MTAPAGLSPAQQQLLARLRSGRAPVARPDIPRLPDLSRVPLNFAQERIWLSQQLAGDLPVFNIGIAARTFAPMVADEVERRLGLVVRRHDALRAGIHALDGAPLMTISDDVPVHVEVLDLRQTPPSNLDERCRAAALEFLSRPYQLDRPPLCRVAVGLLPEDENLIVIGAHHLVADGTSLDIIRREMLAGVELAPPRLRFADVAAWQRGVGSTRNRDEHDRYWLDKLARLPTAFRLGADQPRAGQPPMAGATITTELDETVAARIGLWPERSRPRRSPS